MASRRSAADDGSLRRLGCTARSRAGAKRVKGFPGHATSVCRPSTRPRSRGQLSRPPSPRPRHPRRRARRSSRDRKRAPPAARGQTARPGDPAGTLRRAQCARSRALRVRTRDRERGDGAGRWRARNAIVSAVLAHPLQIQSGPHGRNLRSLKEPRSTHSLERGSIRSGGLVRNPAEPMKHNATGGPTARCG